MKLQFIASVAAVLLNSGHGVFAAKDEPKGLRGSLEFYSRGGNNDGGSNCCGVPVGSSCPAPYKATTNTVNGLELCCINPPNGITSDTPICGGSTRAPPMPKAPQGAVPCISRGGITTCPNGYDDMTIDGSGCTCTPPSARNPRMPRKPRKPAGFIPGPGPRPRPQRGSGQCDVVTNAISRGIGCLNVGDDQSTCEACGCRYVAPARMCVQ